MAAVVLSYHEILVSTTGNSVGRKNRAVVSALPSSALKTRSGLNILKEYICNEAGDNSSQNAFNHKPPPFWTKSFLSSLQTYLLFVETGGAYCMYILSYKPRFYNIYLCYAIKITERACTRPGTPINGGGHELLSV